METLESPAGLDPAEQQRLADAEAVIAAAQRHRLAEARALRAIRDGRLYRATHPTFEAYCRERWGLSRQHVYRLIDHAAVADAVSPVGDVPQLESHARPLVGLTPDQQRQAWAEVIKHQPQDRTASHIKEIARRVRLSPVDGPLVSEVPDPDAPEGQTTPLRWYGAKTRLASTIVGLFPSHNVYVEPFGGGAAVLLAKTPADVEVYADKYDEVVTFFRVLRDHGDELQRRLKLTPYARGEHGACKASPTCDDEIEVARRFFVRSRQSFGGRVDDSWSFSFERNAAAAFANVADLLGQTAERLRRVQIEARDFREVLADVPDREDVLVYCDPPYVRSTRTRHGDAYRHEMTDEDHGDLLALLKGFKKTRVVLSGYASMLYAVGLRTWRRFDFRQRINVTARTKDERRSADRTEVVWCNWYVTSLAQCFQPNGVSGGCSGSQIEGSAHLV